MPLEEFTNCVPTTDFAIYGEGIVIKDTEQRYFISEILGTAPTGYHWEVGGGTILRGVGTDSVIVKFTDHYNSSISCTLSGCSLSLKQKVLIGVSLPPYPNY